MDAQGLEKRLRYVTYLCHIISTDSRFLRSLHTHVHSQQLPASPLQPGMYAIFLTILMTEPTTLEPITNADVRIDDNVNAIEAAGKLDHGECTHANAPRPGQTHRGQEKGGRRIERREQPTMMMRAMNWVDINRTG